MAKVVQRYGLVNRRLHKKSWTTLRMVSVQTWSVGYQIQKLERDEDSELVRAVKWQPYEISFVSIPADANVGVGRDQQQEDFAKEQIMTEEVRKEAEVVAATPKAPEINVDQLRKEAANDEQKRVSEILSLGRKFELNEQAESFVREGKPANDFKDIVLAEQDKRQAIVDNKSTEIGMNDNETRSYSLMRAIRAAASNDWSNAGLEKEASDTVSAQIGRSNGGFFIPREWQTRGTMVTTGSSAIGEHLVATDHLANNFIDALTERLVVKQAGATVLTGLVGNVNIPKAGANAAAAWVAEDNAASESSVGTAQVTLSPKTVSANQSFSHQLIRQSAPAVEQMIQNSIVSQIAIAIDKAALDGGGSNEPSGIIDGGTNQHTTSGADGDAPTWAMINDLVKLIDVDNALGGNLSFVTNAKVMSALRTTGKQSSGVEGNFILGQDNMLIGYPVFNSQVILSTYVKGSSGSTLSAIVYGNFSELVIGEWGTVEIIIDPYTNSNKGQVRLTALSDVDVALLHGESFSYSDEVIAA